MGYLSPCVRNVITNKQRTPTASLCKSIRRFYGGEAGEHIGFGDVIFRTAGSQSEQQGKQQKYRDDFS